MQIDTKPQETDESTHNVFALEQQARSLQEQVHEFFFLSPEAKGLSSALTLDCNDHYGGRCSCLDVCQAHRACRGTSCCYYLIHYHFCYCCWVARMDQGEDPTVQFGGLSHVYRLGKRLRKTSLT